VVKKTVNPFAVSYALLRSHTRLFYCELQHEKELAWRRLRYVGAGVVFLVACGAFLEIAAFGGLRAAGLNLFGSSAVMAAANGILGAVLVWIVGRRPPADGEAFEMSRAEYQRTKQWIENRFVKNGEPSAARSN
jgi:hypothetical protein